MLHRRPYDTFHTWETESGAAAEETHENTRTGGCADGTSDRERERETFKFLLNYYYYKPEQPKKQNKKQHHTSEKRIQNNN